MQLSLLELSSLSDSKVSHLLRLCLPLWVLPACAPPLFNLVHLVSPLPMQCSHPTLPSFFPLWNSSLCISSFSNCFHIPPASSSSPDSLRVREWNAGGLRAKNDEVLHFIWLHPVDPFCNQKSNLNLSSFFGISRYSAQRSHHAHSQTGILSPAVPTSAVSSFLSGSSYPS